MPGPEGSHRQGGSKLVCHQPDMSVRSLSPPCWVALDKLLCLSVHAQSWLRPSGTSLDSMPEQLGEGELLEEGPCLNPMSGHVGP